VKVFLVIREIMLSLREVHVNFTF